MAARSEIRQVFLNISWNQNIILPPAQQKSAPLHVHAEVMSNFWKMEKKLHFWTENENA